MVDDVVKKKAAAFMEAACRLGMELIERENHTPAEEEFLRSLDEVVDAHVP